MSVFSALERPSTPGLFVTGTDTEVGKTVAACLIADQLRRRGADRSPRSRVGVFKPFASGCKRTREGLVSEDAEELAWAADFDPDVGDMSLIAPARFKPPVAPAVAIENDRVDVGVLVDAISSSLGRLDDACEQIIIEGIGGVMVPLAPEPGAGVNRGPYETGLDLMRAIGYPVVVVCRAGLGTLNHTAMTCELIRRAGLSLAGLIVNGYDPDRPDASMGTNREWLAKQNGVNVVATLPMVTGLGSGRRPIKWSAQVIEPALREAIDVTEFSRLCRPGRAPRRETQNL